jgi:hypothetical protein
MLTLQATVQMMRRSDTYKRSDLLHVATMSDCQAKEMLGSRQTWIECVTTYTTYTLGRPHS